MKNKNKQFTNNEIYLLLLKMFSEIGWVQGACEGIRERLDSIDKRINMALARKSTATENSNAIKQQEKRLDSLIEELTRQGHPLEARRGK